MISFLVILLMDMSVRTQKYHSICCHIFCFSQVGVAATATFATSAAAAAEAAKFWNIIN